MGMSHACSRRGTSGVQFQHHGRPLWARNGDAVNMPIARERAQVLKQQYTRQFIHVRRQETWAGITMMMVPTSDIMLGLIIRCVSGIIVSVVTCLNS